MARNDNHAPSTYDPTAYEYLGHVDLMDANRDFPPAVDQFVGNFAEKGTCDHCGTPFLYGAIFGCRTTGKWITVGNQCAINAFGNHPEWARDLARMQKAAKNRKEREATLARANAFARDLGLEDVFALADAEGSREAQILADLHGKLGRYGELTEKQVKFARRLAEKITTPDTCEICGEDHPTRDCPNKGALEVADGRQDVEGIVVSARWQSNGYGDSLKGLIRLDNGSSVWGTIPSAFHFTELGRHLRRGDRVRFVARLKVSDKDPSFGFFSRPTKAELVADAPEDAPEAVR